MAGYRRFVAYVYEYLKGKKGNNCGFIKVEVKEQRCRLELHLQCPGIPAQAEGRLYGFVRNGGLMDGNLLGTCQTEEGAAQCLIETDALDMNGTGIALGRMGGLILITEGGAFFGTEWDDVPIRPENFREVKMEPKEAQGSRRIEKGHEEDRKPDKVEKENEIKKPDREKEENEIKEPDKGKEENEIKGQDREGEEDERKKQDKTEKDEEKEQEEVKKKDRVKELEEVGEKEDIDESRAKTEQAKQETVRKKESKKEDRGQRNMETGDQMPELASQSLAYAETPGNSDVSLRQEGGTGEPGGYEEEMQPQREVMPKQNEERMPRPEAMPEQREERMPCQQAMSERHEERMPEQRLERMPRPQPMPAGRHYGEQPGEDFRPFSDGEILECRRIHIRDLAHLNRRDLALRNNRFLQYGYYNFGHLLICKRADGRYILAVPGGYDQQERFMASTFGFPYFKESRYIQLPKGRGGYWYRLINTPDFH